MGSIEAFILAGGKSRRMGTDKSRLTIDGETFATRIASELAPLTPRISLVGNNATATGLNHVADVYPEWGALGGVHAALSNCSAEWALVVACDYPFVTTDLFRRLAALRDDFEAVAPVQSDLIPQPLCALYRVQPCLALAERLIKTGERKPIALLQSVRTRWTSFDELADLDRSSYFFENINTPEDYDRAVAESGNLPGRVQ
ncbi:MAG TPA: molybdenum cofactor guanylyltransferase [Pyrinomonadaceae bacterium]|nr:molybdenum cofactor guanylyltransferase [Pyrinomonadaceae bacterium]